MIPHRFLSVDRYHYSVHNVPQGSVPIYPRGKSCPEDSPSAYCAPNGISFQYQDRYDHTPNCHTTMSSAHYASHTPYQAAVGFPHCRDGHTTSENLALCNEPLPMHTILGSPERAYQQVCPPVRSIPNNAHSADRRAQNFPSRCRDGTHRSNRDCSCYRR